MMKFATAIVSLFFLPSIGLAYTGKCNRAIHSALERPLRGPVPTVSCPGGLDIGGTYTPFSRTRLRGCEVGERNDLTYGSLSCTLNLRIVLSTPTGVEDEGCRVDSVEIAEIVTADATCLDRFHEATGY